MRRKEGGIITERWNREGNTRKVERKERKAEKG